jgi:hypothetical protein
MMASLHRRDRDQRSHPARLLLSLVLAAWRWPGKQGIAYYTAWLSYKSNRQQIKAQIKSNVPNA